MAKKESVIEARILQTLIRELTPIDDESKKRLLETVSLFFNLNSFSESNRNEQRSEANGPLRIAISDQVSEPNPKEFLINKNPQTLVERVACLAFYLAHYRDVPHFKTFDISKLNTEAAQSKFSNTAQSVADATKAGFLAPAGRGNKQISGLGEKYVRALPDRTEAKSVLMTMRPQRSRAKARKNSKAKK